MNNDELKAIQDVLVERAKQTLLTEGQLDYLGLVITKQTNIGDLSGEEFGSEFIEVMDGEPEIQDQNGIAILVVDLQMSGKKMFFAACRLYPQAASTLKFLVEKGKTLFGKTEPDVFEDVMNSFMKFSGINEKDLIAGIMKEVCQKVDAFATIMLSEALAILIDKDEKDSFTKDLEDDPRSKEVIVCFMDTLEFRRMINVDIFRKDGAITAFGEPDIHMDNKDGEAPLVGRFVDILAPLSKAQA